MMVAGAFASQKRLFLYELDSLILNNDKLSVIIERGVCCDCIERR